MPNLEEKIADWRKQMAGGGIKTRAVLDELESHLREDVERQLRSGQNEKKAFETAVQHIGRSELLRTEFAKVGGFKEARQGKVIGIALCVLAAAFSLLVTPRLLTIHEMGIGQRLMGLAAVAVTFLSIASWRFSYKYLPVIRARPLRMAAGLACGLVGAFWLYAFGGLLLNVIVPHLLRDGASAESIRGSVMIGLNNAPSGQIAPIFMIGISILWAMALMAVLGGLAFGLEEAARRQFRKDAYV